LQIHIWLLFLMLVEWFPKAQEEIINCIILHKIKIHGICKSHNRSYLTLKVITWTFFSQSSPTTIHCDSQNVIALNENPKYHSRSKHVEIQYHFTRKIMYLTNKSNSSMFLHQIWPLIFSLNLYQEINISNA
jgi:hypothetical protein